MSRKTASTASVLQHAQGLGRGVAALDRADPWVALEQEHQLVERGSLVIDDEDVQCHTWTPGANLGTRTMTLVPAPGAVSTTRP